MSISDQLVPMLISLGPEKLLEVWFAPDADALPQSCSPNGLKAVSPETWKDMLDLVHCKVLSVVESEYRKFLG